jgi:hypothetical protein
VQTEPRRKRLLAAALLVAFPLISGLFFALVAAAAALPAGAGHALVVGAIVGGAMFAANALALCLAVSAAQGQAPQMLQRAELREARAS